MQGHHPHPRRDVGLRIGVERVQRRAEACPVGDVAADAHARAAARTRAPPPPDRSARRRRPGRRARARSPRTSAATRHPAALRERRARSTAAKRSKRARPSADSQRNIVPARAGDRLAQGPVAARRAMANRSGSDSPHQGARSIASHAATVSRLQQRVRERDDVEHRLALGQAVEFDRGVGDAGAAQRGQNVRQVGAPAHQHGDLLRAPVASAALDARHDRPGFLLRHRCEGRASPPVRARRSRTATAALNATAPCPVATRDGKPAKVRLTHSTRPRCERKLRDSVERLERDAADSPPFLGLDEQAHLGIAEAVDRLHRIADQKQRPPVPRGPACGQIRDQVALRLRRVLKFVDQQVLHARIEREQQVRRRIARFASASKAISVAALKSMLLLPREDELQPVPPRAAARRAAPG